MPSLHLFQVEFRTREQDVPALALVLGRRELCRRPRTEDPLEQALISARRWWQRFRLSEYGGDEVRALQHRVRRDPVLVVAPAPHARRVEERLAKTVRVREDRPRERL